MVKTPPIDQPEDVKKAEQSPQSTDQPTENQSKEDHQGERVPGIGTEFEPGARRRGVDRERGVTDQKSQGNPPKDDHTVSAQQPDNPPSKPNASNTPKDPPVSENTHNMEVPPDTVPSFSHDIHPNLADDPLADPNAPGTGRNIGPQHLYPVRDATKPNPKAAGAGESVYIGDEHSGAPVFAVRGAQNDPNSPHSVTAATSADNTAPHTLEKPTADEFLAPYKEYQDIAHAINLALYKQVTKLGYDFWWAKTCLNEAIKYLNRDWVNERDQGKYDQPTAAIHDEKTVSANSGNNPDTDNDPVESVDSPA
jgi:hypothetical protein